MSGSSLAPRAPKDLGLRATLGAILGASAAYALGVEWTTCAIAGGLAAVSTRIALIDLKMRIILDRDLLAMGAIGLVWTGRVGSDAAADCLIAVVRGLGYAAAFQAVRLGYDRLRGRDGLGFGDVKLVAAAGPLLTVELFGLTVAGAAMSGLLFAVIRTRLKQRPISRYTYIPFGSSLALTIYAFWFTRL